jgi:outer membrane protein assembly factor BamA
MRLKIAIAGIIFGLYLCLPVGNAQSINAKIDSLSIRTITICGNHRTQNRIILKELPVTENSMIALSDTARIKAICKTNLIKTSLFNFVDIAWGRTDSLHIDLIIALQERWYIIPRLKIKTEEENINAWAEHMNFGHLSALLSVTDENFRGAREQLTIMGSLGFNQSIGLKYLRPSIFGITTLGGGVEIQYTSNKEATSGLFDYKPRYYISPSEPLISNVQATAMIYFRPSLPIDELLAVTYSHTQFNDTLQWINRSYYPEKSTELLKISSKLKFDFRDNKAYPLKGSYYDLILEKVFDLAPSVNPIDYGALTVNGRWFGKLGTKSFFALGGTLSASSSGDYLYPFGIRIGQSGLEIRSFEQVQIPVTALAIGRTTLKYQLLKKDKQKIRFLDDPKFALIHYAIYATLFADGAYADYQRAPNYEQSLFLKNHWLSSVGCGLDFSTYYDLVIRTEYSYNFAFQKQYFFVHFKAAI